MITLVKEYINKQKLFLIEDKLILAISGGADSVCLMHVLLELGFRFDLAHCNFKLRAKESDADEVFVKELAKKHDLKFHSKSFSTIEYANQNKISIQMASRELRYRWLNELLKSENAKYIAVAHHQDDAIETFFINLIRGTGISGLLGIAEKRNNIVRPLLNLNRSEIEEYLLAKKQTFREDSSNTSVKYLRNKIRLQLIPLLEEMNPKIKETIKDEMEILKDTSTVFSHQIKSVRKAVIKRNNKFISLNIQKLKILSPLRIYLYELIKPFGFNQIDAIILALDNQCGKQFFSNTHELLIDREKIFISKINPDNFPILEIMQTDKQIKYPIQLKLSINKDINISDSNNIAQFDLEKLKFPLLLRKWKKGDKFKPFGMKNFKKLSDFFIDNKFTQLQKKEQWLLCSNDKIIWVVGCRIDDRYRIQSTTKKLYIAELLNNK